jgi:transcriptional antiterminator NusG
LDEKTVDKKWYVVRTFSGHEIKVKTFIQDEAIRLGLEDRITNVFVPSEKVFEIKDGKKKSKTKTFFPGYILVEAILDKETKHLIINSPSVMSFVGPRAEPAPLHPDEVRRIIGTMEEEVIDGPFNNFSGFVQEINKERMKLKVMVSIFGRKTPIELDFSQVEVEK